MHTNGISYEGDILDLAVAKRIVTRSGSWFRYGESHLGQGKERARAFLMENPDLTEQIKEKVLAAGGFEDLIVAPADGEATESTQ
jgi:recombination protein RecA